MPALRLEREAQCLGITSLAAKMRELWPGQYRCAEKEEMSDPSIQEILKETVQLCRELNDLVAMLNKRLGEAEVKIAALEQHHHKLPDTQVTDQIWGTGPSVGLPLYPAGEGEG